jgi:hypothetical protein
MPLSMYIYSHSMLSHSTLRSFPANNPQNPDLASWTPSQLSSVDGGVIWRITFLGFSGHIFLLRPASRRVLINQSLGAHSSSDSVILYVYLQIHIKIYLIFIEVSFVTVSVTVQLPFNTLQCCLCWCIRINSHKEKISRMD